MANKEDDSLPKSFWAILGLAIVVALAIIIGLLAEIISKQKTPDVADKRGAIGPSQTGAAANPTPLPEFVAGAPKDEKTTSEDTKLMSCRIESSGPLSSPDFKTKTPRVFGFDTTQSAPQIWLFDDRTLTLHKVRIEVPPDDAPLRLLKQKSLLLSCGTTPKAGCLDGTVPAGAKVAGRIIGDSGFITGATTAGAFTARVRGENLELPLGQGLGLCGGQWPAETDWGQVSVPNGETYLVGYVPSSGVMALTPALSDRPFYRRTIPEHPTFLAQLRNDSLTTVRCDGFLTERLLTSVDTVGPNTLVASTGTNDSLEHVEIFEANEISGQAAVSGPTSSLSEQDIGGHVINAGWLTPSSFFVQTSNWIATRQRVRVFTSSSADTSGASPTYQMSAAVDGLSRTRVLPSLSRATDSASFPKLLAAPARGGRISSLFSASPGALMWIQGANVKSITVSGLDLFESRATWMPLSSQRFLYLGHRTDTSEARYQVIACR